MALADFLPINQIAQEGAAKLQEDLQKSLGGFSMKFGLNKKTQSLLKFTRVRVGEKFGVVDKISVKLPRHGIFRAKGLGRGTPASKAGQTARTPADWLNPVVEKNYNEIKDKITEAFPSATLRELKSILIK